MLSSHVEMKQNSKGTPKCLTLVGSCIDAVISLEKGCFLLDEIGFVFLF